MEKMRRNEEKEKQRVKPNDVEILNIYTCMI